jgi:FtsP/CotA-like multicopper oxidase with cupredoxin domain
MVRAGVSAVVLAPRQTRVLRGPKDTVFIPPGSTVRFALRFSDYTDPTTPYMYHCHVLAHEDNGMMGQFTVVEPDEAEAARVPPGMDD